MPGAGRPWPGGLPVRVLDHRVRAGEYQPRVTVVETHQIRRFAPLAVHLDDLAVPVRVTDDVSVNADPVADYRFHARPPSTLRCVTNTASHVPPAVTTTAGQDKPLPGGFIRNGAGSARQDRDGHEPAARPRGPVGEEILRRRAGG